MITMIDWLCRASRRLLLASTAAVAFAGVSSATDGGDRSTPEANQDGTTQVDPVKASLQRLLDSMIHHHVFAGLRRQEFHDRA